MSTKLTLATTLTLLLARSAAGAMVCKPNPNGVPAGVPTAIVWFDHRVKGSPDLQATAINVPSYNPNIPYKADNPCTSPLFPPKVKGGRPYLGDRPYNGVDLSVQYGPVPSGPVGYGRAFNQVGPLDPTAGSPPAVLLNTSNEARPADVEAVASGPNHLPLPATAGEQTPVNLVPVAAGSAGVPTTAPAGARVVALDSPPRPAAATQVAAAEKPVSPQDRIAIAFTLEDSRHARADLPTPVRPPH